MVELNTVTSWFHHGGQYPVSNYLLRTIRTEQFVLTIYPISKV